MYSHGNVQVKLRVGLCWPRQFRLWSRRCPFGVMVPALILVRLAVEIITSRYVKHLVSDGSRSSKDPPVDPFGIARGLGGYAHRTRSRAPSGQRVRPSLIPQRLRPKARGLPRTLGTRSTAPPHPTFGSCPATDVS
jgi:hypothetical protein